MKKLFDFSGLHPLLFAILPLLSLWSANYDKLTPIDVFSAFFLSIVLAVIIYILFARILKNGKKAGLLTTLILLLFFTYGHVYDFIKGVSLFGILIGRHRFLGPFWLIMLMVGTVLILKYGNKAVFLNRYLNQIGLVLVLFTVGNLLVLYYQSETKKGNANVDLSTIPGLNSMAAESNPDTRPDIYYILLDGYSRDDVIQNYYKFDNSAFIVDLKNLGFIIPACTQSNYAWTALSMPATLNMNYFNDYTHNSSFPARLDYDVQGDYTVHSLVRAFLAQQGYTIVSFQNGFPWTELRDANVYYGAGTFLQRVTSTNEFDDLLLETSGLRPYYDFAEISANSEAQMLGVGDDPGQPTAIPTDLQKTKYNDLMNEFSNIEKAIHLPGKKFIYLHVPAPHNPYVVNPSGAYSPVLDPVVGYTNQVQYLNKRIIPIIQDILANSKTPPVIVIQADHGWVNDPKRVDILNAYYLPNGGNKQIYPTITPVNTFRIIFNTYFGANLPLLKDESFYSPALKQFDFSLVPSTCTNH
ncbi:MAG: hypothetical protein P4L50_25895 [Anaerolineaceae bacterium]|nr:hypothetical protein [Anaerolineaceae bacterium]